jgi:hypothetical protein
MFLKEQRPEFLLARARLPGQPGWFWGSKGRHIGLKLYLNK